MFGRGISINKKYLQSKFKMSNTKVSNNSNQKGVIAPMKICMINSKLIAEITGLSSSDFHKIQILDLHLKDESKGKIRKQTHFLID